MELRHLYLSVENNKKRLTQQLILFLSIALISFPSQVDAKDVPKSCFRNDGLIDLKTCKGHILKVPYELLEKGYYNNFGELEPGLLDQNLWQFDAGTQVQGNVLRMSNRLTWNDVKRRAKEQGIDVNLLVGGMATDSARYLNTFAWLRKAGSSDQFFGPVFVTSNAAPVHMRQRACKYGTVGEINSDVYFAIGGTSGALNVEVVFTSTDVYVAPDANLANDQFVNYPEKFLEAASYACP